MDVSGRHPALLKAVKPPVAEEKVAFSQVPASLQSSRSSTSAAAAAGAAEKCAKATLSDPDIGSLSQQQRDLLAQKYQELFSSIDQKYAELVDQGIEEGLEYAKLEREISLAVEKLEDLKVSLREDAMDFQVDVATAEALPKLVELGEHTAGNRDLAQWIVVDAESQRQPGESVVWTLSLKDGSEEFLRQAKLCYEHGDAVRVVAIDASGTANTVREKGLPSGFIVLTCKTTCKQKLSQNRASTCYESGGEFDSHKGFCAGAIEWYHTLPNHCQPSSKKSSHMTAFVKIASA
eukprot:3711714-Amphidinium_carterae.1